MITTGIRIPRAVLGTLFLAAALILVTPVILAATGGQSGSAPASRFEDRGDGTILDRQTGLLWLKNGKSTLGAITWQEAGAFCSGLQYAGFTDWRLPTKEEFAAIVDTANQGPALPMKSPFENVVTFLDYWTQSDHTHGPGYAWAVNLYYGNKKFLNKKKYAFAWPVRRLTGGSETPAWPSPDSSTWASLKTRYTVIHYPQQMGLSTFSRALYPLALRAQSEAALKSRVDALFREVQTLLDMRKAVNRVTITVYTDRQQMEKALAQTVGEGRQRRAWYSRKENTIFVNVDQVTEDILAHEMAMAVIYQYMEVPPPRTTAKILAAYVGSQRKSSRGSKSKAADRPAKTR